MNGAPLWRAHPDLPAAHGGTTLARQVRDRAPEGLDPRAERPLFLDVQRVSGCDGHGHRVKPFRVTWLDEDGERHESYFRTAGEADAFHMDIRATARGHT